MIAFLRGRLIAKRPNFLIIDVQGVGYAVQAPLSTFYVIGDAGAEVALHVHTHVREDAISLFGFATPLEQELFERLIGVSGIGPKVALAVLSGIEPPELVKAVRSSNIARLTAIPGVGKKTAERLALELKDKLPLGLIEAVETPVHPATPGDAMRADVISALLNLGYHRPLAEKAVTSAMDVNGSSSFETTLRQALRELSK